MCFPGQPLTLIEASLLKLDSEKPVINSGKTIEDINFDDIHSSNKVVLLQTIRWVMKQGKPEWTCNEFFFKRASYSSACLAVWPNLAPLLKVETLL